MLHVTILMVGKTRQAFIQEGLALLDEGFPGFAYHEDGYVEH